MTHLALVPELVEATPAERLRAALADHSEAVLSGCAGTGKTYTVRQLLGAPGVVLCAPTAKAAGRLKEVTGRVATTVHRLIYGAPTTQWVRSDGEVCQGYVDEAGQKHKAPGCPGCACTERLVFALPDEARSGASDDVQLIIVDEASMVDEQMASDVRAASARLGARILWVGDPAQLPPVGGNPGVDLQQPDVLLERVYRQQGGLLELATEIRQAETWEQLSAALRAPHDGVELRDDGLDGLADWRAGGSRRMAIVHSNRQRVDANSAVRQALGREGPLVMGDRIIVRKNAQMVPVWNGEVYVVQSTQIVDPFTVVNCRLDGVQGAPTIQFVVHERYLAEADGQQFGRDSHRLRDQLRSRSAVVHDPRCSFFDFDSHGDCVPEYEHEDGTIKGCRQGPLAGLSLVNAQHGFVITCHASQGSEAEQVGVLWTPRTHRGDLAAARSWLYTAVTRARSSLVIWSQG